MTRTIGFTLAAVGAALAVSASTEPDAVTRWLIVCAGLALAGVGVTYLTPPALTVLQQAGALTAHDRGAQLTHQGE